MLVEVIHVEDYEEDQYTDFLSIALKQTKAEPKSSGTPFLIYFMIIKT